MLQPKLKSYPLPVNNLFFSILCFGPFVTGPQRDEEDFSMPVALVFLKIAKLLHTNKKRFDIYLYIMPHESRLL